MAPGIVPGICKALEYVPLVGRPGHWTVGHIPTLPGVNFIGINPWQLFLEQPWPLSTWFIQWKKCFVPLKNCLIHHKFINLLWKKNLIVLSNRIGQGASVSFNLRSQRCVWFRRYKENKLKTIYKILWFTPSVLPVSPFPQQDAYKFASQPCGVLHPPFIEPFLFTFFYLSEGQRAESLGQD